MSNFKNLVSSLILINMKSVSNVLGADYDSKISLLHAIRIDSKNIKFAVVTNDKFVSIFVSGEDEKSALEAIQDIRVCRHT